MACLASHYPKQINSNMKYYYQVNKDYCPYCHSICETVKRYFNYNSLIAGFTCHKCGKYKKIKKEKRRKDKTLF